MTSPHLSPNQELVAALCLLGLAWLLWDLFIQVRELRRSAQRLRHRLDAMTDHGGEG